MRIACIGGGPAGLYFAISMKLRDPSHEITVYERNRPGDTFGWGVVFSDQTMENLRSNDRVSADQIAAAFTHWDDIDVHIRGRTVRSSGHGFAGIGRKRMLNLLQDRARELGVQLEFEIEIEPDDPRLAGCDLVIAGDGANSRIRNRWPEEFGVDVDVRANRYVWLGVRKTFDAFTFAFEETEHGWVWAHAYKFDDAYSTFIVEMSEETWRGLGLDEASQEETCRAAEQLFGKFLDGEKLETNARHLRGSAWLKFPRVLCQKWAKDNIILMGDAAHTAHFSIGSGTKLAFEDAITLANVLHAGPPLTEALLQYQNVRQVEVLKLQNAARNSTEWFENVERYVDLDPLQFAYSLLTRSQRVSHENLRVRDKAFLERVEIWFAESATGKKPARPHAPMFTPIRLREMDIRNRIVVSPMCVYAAKDGAPNDFHFVHYGTRASGGAGLIFTEMTCVAADGRITPGCAGLYADEHEHAWKRIVDYVHGHSGARFALQLGHAGPKGSTRIPWEEDHADQPLAKGGWGLIGPSATPWSERNPAPRAMTRTDMDRVREEFVAATERGVRAGFDMLELHCAHGYLLSAFLTPLMNRRIDAYGGDVQGRLRFPLEVFEAMRAVWPRHKPMSVRLSATDWMKAGLSAEDSVAIARAFQDAGADLIDVSAGQTSPAARPVYGRMFQTPYSDLIRNEAKVRTMAVGNIYEPDHVNSILAAGRADLCALARPHLLDPYWTARAAAELGDDRFLAPINYRPGETQLKRNMARRDQTGGAV